ncbi:MAG: InlB B-repeat-containing protein, partial [Clostridiales bacterium]|nr:InlB B-repeat-containing protein [Clostridiales bacterium]
MKNISKKVLALALSFSMIVTLLPTQAIAEEEENVSVAMESEEVYNEEISLDDTDDNTEILQSAVDEDSQSEETIIDMPSEDAETSTDSAETDTNNSSEEQAITTSFMMDGAILTDGVAEEEENAAVVTESEAAFDESDDEETVLVDVDESTGITESVDDKDDISEEILTDTVSDSSETKSNLASEDQAALTAESEAVTYSYRYKIYTWNDTTFNFYRPYKTVSNVTSTSATVSIPTGSISLANVTINEEEYKPVGWTVSSSNYTVLRTEATCEVGDNITTDISELASNKYVEVFAVYEKVITEYTVTFNSNGGSEVESQTVKEGETAKEPTEPTLDGYTFAGWYSDAELTTAYDFSTSVSSDVTLYAKWEEEAKETAYDEEVVIGSEGSTYTWVQYIVYHTNYPDGTDATYTVKYTIYSNSSSKSGKLKTYAECGYTLPEGYSLRDSKYWNSSADGSTAYYSSSFNFLNGNDGLVKDLYAIYTKNTYT